MNKLFVLPLAACTVMFFVGCVSEEKTYQDGVVLGMQLSESGVDLSDFDSETLEAVLSGDKSAEDLLSANSDRLPGGRLRVKETECLDDLAIGVPVYISPRKLNVTPSGRVYLNRYADGRLEERDGDVKVVKLSQNTAMIDLQNVSPSEKWTPVHSDDYFDDYIKIVKIRNSEARIKLTTKN